ncbi:MAG: BrnT family toxin [Gemmatimonadales bacterium]
MAIQVFDGPVLERDDRRRDYGEARFVALGRVADVILAVVYTRRASAFRLISARRANRYEKAAYREIRPPEAQGPHGLGGAPQSER